MRSHYVYFLRLIRSGAFERMTPDEEAILHEHFIYLQGLLKDGRLQLAGPCLDGSVGIVIFAADTEQIARAIMEADPAVKGGVMTAELHPFRVSLAR